MTLTLRNINLQPYLNKRLFGEHPSVLTILLFENSVDPDPLWLIIHAYKERECCRLTG